MNRCSIDFTSTRREFYLCQRLGGCRMRLERWGWLGNLAKRGVSAGQDTARASRPSAQRGLLLRRFSALISSRVSRHLGVGIAQCRRGRTEKRVEASALSGTWCIFHRSSMLPLHLARKPPQKQDIVIRAAFNSPYFDQEN